MTVFFVWCDIELAKKYINCKQISCLIERKKQCQMFLAERITSMSL